MQSNREHGDSREQSKNRCFVLEISKDGTVLLPRDHEICLEIAKALGDKKAIQFCEQAALSEVLIGKRMCG